LIFPQTVEGVDVRALEHGLDGCHADALIAKSLGKPHERGKAVGMTARAPMLEEEQDPEALAQLGQGQGGALVAIFIDPPDILERRSRQSHDSHFHERPHERARGVVPRAAGLSATCLQLP